MCSLPAADWRQKGQVTGVQSAGPCRYGAKGDKPDVVDDVLLGIVLRRLGESPLAEQPASLLLAALDAEESLSDQLGGHAAPRRSGVQAGTPLPEPAGAYLQSLTVTGFRGIGEPATLSLTPGPGLTLVVGRNGSGKSSFAEALEVLLTGELRRWEKLPAVWRQGWPAWTPSPVRPRAGRGRWPGCSPRRLNTTRHTGTATARFADGRER